jgi:S-adenosylmethionine:tRNA ribosyltransferase-isomerase
VTAPPGARGAGKQAGLPPDQLDYELPAERIAQHPTARREDSRLLVVERAGGALHDARFAELGDWLRPGDVLALNETRVRPARLRLRRASGGAVEILVLRPEEDGRWRLLARPARSAPVGGRLFGAELGLELEIEQARPRGERLVRVRCGDLEQAMERGGEVPLPPYIRRAPEPGDRERYQTVFARVAGAVAAPTAGLHFTEALLAGLAARGVASVRVLLHVGPGTFRPLARAHPAPEQEWFEVGAEAARRLAAARAAGGRIVAVGTTVVRALESACDAHHGALGPARGWTRKFLVPGDSFRAVDALITNFHLPRTPLLLLVAAFAGPETVRRAYAHAVAAHYRFYSYGDAMLVV